MSWFNKTLQEKKIALAGKRAQKDELERHIREYHRGSIHHYDQMERLAREIGELAYEVEGTTQSEYTNG